MKIQIFLLIPFLFSAYNLMAIDVVLPLDILEKQQEIKNFRVEVVLEICTYAGQNSEFFFTYYYEEPDKIYLETDDFVLLPKEALKTLQPAFFQADKYSFNYLGKEEGLDILELIPLDKGGKDTAWCWLLIPEIHRSGPVSCFSRWLIIRKNSMLRYFLRR